MRAFNRIFIAVLCVFVLIFVCANAALLRENRMEGRPYRVEISRLALEIEQNGIESIRLSDCAYVTGVSEYGEDFYNSSSDYAIREIGGRLYRFDYTVSKSKRRRGSNRKRGHRSNGGGCCRGDAVCKG